MGYSVRHMMAMAFAFMSHMKTKAGIHCGIFYLDLSMYFVRPPLH